MRLSVLGGVAVLLVMASAAPAQVTPAPIFTDNLVLQRDRKVPVWGKADPGEKVTVKFAGQTVDAVAGADGAWMAELEPMPASSENRVMTISGAGNALELKNVLVGEVWLCGGQSNMEFPLWGKGVRFRQAGGDKIAATADYPLIRIIRVPRLWSPVPVVDLEDIAWQPVNPETVQPFSAVAFFFAREIQEKLQIPVGLIGVYWSGSNIEPFIPPEGFAGIPALAEMATEVNAKLPGTAEYRRFSEQTIRDYDKWLTAFKAAAESGAVLPPPPAFPRQLVPYDAHRRPTAKYNRMIFPLVPYAVRGAIWYQGCANRGDGALYTDKMQALYNGWKKVFRNPDLQFFFAQLAPYGYGGWQKHDDKLPQIWEAQQRFAEANGDAVGMAVINDVGDLKDIHPADKTQVGHRLALLALKRTYGFKDLKADSPVLADSKVENGRFVLTFRNVENFKTRDGRPAEHFEVAGADGVYFPATAEISGNTVTVGSDRVNEPCNLRFMWDQLAEATLFNESGLPLGAFRIESEIPDADALIKALSKSHRLVYQYNLRNRAPQDGGHVKYDVDRSAEAGNFNRIVYLVVARDKSGATKWAMAGMDAFTTDAGKIGIPILASGASFQTKVGNLMVRSNVPGVLNGEFPDGNIEFFPNNYTMRNQLNLPGANASAYDFDDKISNSGVGYGSMQVHNYRNRQTVFAYNNFRAGRPDFGIGNSDGKHPDWTFTRTMANFPEAKLYVFVGNK